MHDPPQEGWTQMKILKMYCSPLLKALYDTSVKSKVDNMHTHYLGLTFLARGLICIAILKLNSKEELL